MNDLDGCISSNEAGEGVSPAEWKAATAFEVRYLALREIQTYLASIQRHLISLEYCWETSMEAPT
jgi:hypothetical protein